MSFKKTPQLWRCFDPEHNSGGDALTFVSEYEKVDINEAGRLIARWFAIGTEPNLIEPQQCKQRRRHVSGQPSHKAFVVEDRGEGDDKDAFWTRVGSAWPHGDGKGLNIQLAPGLAVSGRVVLREFTSEDAEEEKRRRQQAQKGRGHKLEAPPTMRGFIFEELALPAGSGARSQSRDALRLQQEE